MANENANTCKEALNYNSIESIHQRNANAMET